MVEVCWCECCGKSVSGVDARFCSSLCEARLREFPSPEEIDHETRRFQASWRAKDFRRRDASPAPTKHWHVPVISSAWLPEVAIEEV